MMREYPLTGPEMWQLASIGVAATVFFGAGTFCLSAWFDIYRDLAVPASELTPEMRGYWSAALKGFGWASGAFFGLGVVLTAVNGLTIVNIIRNTEHSK